MSGFRNSGSSRKTYFLGVNGDGNVYESSKEPKEGFTQHINPMNNMPSGYRKEYYNGLVGYLNYIGLKTRPNKQNQNVTYFIITFRNYQDDEDYCIMFPLYTPKGGIHRYVKSFVKYYQNIDYSRELVFNAFKRRPEDNYAPSNLLFAYPGNGAGTDELIPMYFQNGKNGWPAATDIQGFDGTKKKDYTAQDRFTYDKLNEYINDFNSRIPAIRSSLAARFGNGSGNTAQAQPQMYQVPVTPPQAAPAPQQAAPYQQPVVQNYQQPQPQAYQAPAPQGYQQPQAPQQPASRPQAPTTYGASVPPNYPPQEDPGDDLPF